MVADIIMLVVLVGAVLGLEALYHVLREKP
jgi:hypothetical protein